MNSRPEKQGGSKAFSVLARIKSMQYALNGIGVLVREEHNARVHAVATLCVLVLGFVLGLSAMQWVAILMLIGAVWMAEALNSAIEYLCDKVSPEHDPQIGRAKDVAAAAVLIVSVIAAVCGCIIFYQAWQGGA